MIKERYGRAGSSFQMIQPVLKWSYKFISIFTNFALFEYRRGDPYMNANKNFVSLTRNKDRV